MSDHTPQGQPGDEAVRWSRGGGPAPSASVQSTIHQMTDQLQTVIEAAERAAEAIRHDAEEQARRHLAEAQRKADRLTAERVGLISELTDDQIRHAANVRDHSEQMVRALEDAINSVTDKLEQPAMSDPLGAAVATPSPPLGDQPSRDETGLPPRPATPPVHSGYTDLVGTPPPPLPASAPAPVPPRTTLPGLSNPPTGAPQPTPDNAAAAAASQRSGEPGPPQPPTPGTQAADPDLGEEEPPRSPPWGRLPGARRARWTAIEPPVSPPPAPESVRDVPLSAPGAGEQAVSEDALLHATRLAAAGETRETIADVLRQVWGVNDPDPIVDRVLSNR